MLRNTPRSRQALFIERHAVLGFKRVLRRYQPPQFIQAQPFEGLQTDMQMAFMRRVEGATEQADPPASAPQCISAALAWAGGWALEGLERFQGRTWPVPKILYL